MICIPQIAVILGLVWRGLWKRTVIVSVRFEVIKAASIKIAVLRDIMLCIFVGGTCCFYLIGVRLCR